MKMSDSWSIKSVFVAFAMLAVVAVGAPKVALAHGGMPESFADLVEDAGPAVVNISTSATVKQRDFSMPQFPPGSPFEEFFRRFYEQQGEGNGKPRKVSSLGSGFVISAEGIVVTNNHVIDEADEIKVIFNDGTELDAELLGADAKTDLAVLKVKSDKPLKYVSWGDSDDVRVGDWVVSIGNPLGLGGTVTAGIVSARNRDINAGPYDEFIQTDAAINKGNSGGPLFTTEGKVVGINTAILSPNGGSIGIGFAVPSNLARDVIGQILEFGEIRRGWLGVRIQMVTDEIAEGLGLDKPRGALVAGVFEGDPAARAGMKVGDVIVKFNGEKVKDSDALPRMVANTTIGETVPVVVFRDGKEVKLSVHIAKMDEDDPRFADNDEQQPAQDKDKPVEPAKVYGMQLAPIDGDAIKRFKLDEDTKGVLVQGVERGSVAAEKDVRGGEVIAEVSGREVTSPSDILNQLEALKAEGKEVALFMIRSRRGDMRFVPFRLEDLNEAE